MGDVVIVGAGPAGATLALLLAQRGVGVTLVERRRDFAREFRGEVLMPSGIEAIEQMGLRATLADIPHHTQEELEFYLNGRRIFTETLEPDDLQGRRPIAFSQPAFLERVVQSASEFPQFKFERGVAVRDLCLDGGRVTGITIRDEDGERTISADLVIGADGRNSVVRRQLGLSAKVMSPPMDIVWCKLTCPPTWRGLHAYIGRGHLLAAYRTWDGSLQLGWVILKGRFRELRSKGVEVWVEEMAKHVSPELGAHLRANLDNLQKPFLLESASDRVDNWSVPGALVIGDAAHTMSPVGGQGINIALRDAIVTANHLVPVLNQPVDETKLTNALKAIEEERLPEVAPIQEMQAQPPRLVLSRAWWGEPLRGMAAFALARPRIRYKVAQRLSALPFGITDVRLSV